jgi:hypothetical protein
LHANTNELEELLLPILQKINLLSLWFQMPKFLRKLFGKAAKNTKDSKFVCFKNHALENQISTKSRCHGSVRLMAPKNGNCPRKVEIRELDIVH